VAGGSERVAEGRAPVQDLTASAPAQDGACVEQYPQMVACRAERQAGERGELAGRAGLVEKPQDAGAVRADEAGQAVRAGVRASRVGERAGHGVDERVPVRKFPHVPAGVAVDGHEIELTCLRQVPVRQLVPVDLQEPVAEPGRVRRQGAEYPGPPVARQPAGARDDVGLEDTPPPRPVRHERRRPHPAQDARHRVAQPRPVERGGQRADGELADLGPDPVVVPGRELVKLVGERGAAAERRQREEVRYPAGHLATPRPPHAVHHRGAQPVVRQHAEAGLAVQRAERPDPRCARRVWPAQDHQRGDRLAEGGDDEPAMRQQVGAHHPALPHLASGSALRGVSSRPRHPARVALPASPCPPPPRPARFRVLANHYAPSR
jgi:hypothetical protein